MSYTNIIGADELLAKVESLLPAVENAVKMCGLHVEKEAKRLCPVDDGTLRNSIQASEVESWYGDRGFTYRCTVGTNVEYAPYLEVGSGTKEGGKHARYIMKRGIESKFDEMKKQTEEILKGGNGNISINFGGK